MTPAPDSHAEEQTASAPAGEGGEIVARPARYYRFARYLMALIVIGSGLYFAYDGWVGWPKQNAKYAEVDAQLQAALAKGDKENASKLQEQLKDLSHHSPFDIRIQKILGYVLPPIGLALVCWALYNSRGTYRLAGTTLHVPGHPPVPVESIRQIDKQKWDRKGIAYIDYELANGQARKGTIKIDDFVYEQAPTQAIMKRIEALVLPEGGEVQDAQPATERQDA